jgi:hypothetical protein
MPQNTVLVKPLQPGCIPRKPCIGYKQLVTDACKNKGNINQILSHVFLGVVQ